MSLDHIFPVVAVIVPVLLLFLVGGFIALNSGVQTVDGKLSLREVAGNFSGMILRVAGYVCGLLILQHFAGFRASFGW